MTPPDPSLDFGETWVRLRPLKDPNGVPASVRVRRALKCLLRSYGLRAEQVTGVPPPGARAPAPSESDG